MRQIQKDQELKHKQWKMEALLCSLYVCLKIFILLFKKKKTQEGQKEGIDKAPPAHSRPRPGIPTPRPSFPNFQNPGSSPLTGEQCQMCLPQRCYRSGSLETELHCQIQYWQTRALHLVPTESSGPSSHYFISISQKIVIRFFNRVISPPPQKRHRNTSKECK